MSTKDELLKNAALFCEENSVKESTLGRIVMNDGKFFKRLEEDGRDCTTAALDKFNEVFSDPKKWEEAKQIARERAAKPQDEAAA